MTKYITLHPQYFLKEGFGTLMSHYAVMYSLYRDLNVIPVILDFDFKSQKLTSAMEGFNNFGKKIIYHYEAFGNFKNIFSIMNETNINNYNWISKNFTNSTYDQLVKKIECEKDNLVCIWSLSQELTNKYFDDIVNHLFIFNTNITNISKKYLPKTDKEIVAICVRNEYKKFDCPHTKLSLDFYIEAMKQYDINNSKYLIFSDDIPECKKIFSVVENEFDISYTEPMQSAIGMCLMSLCDHIICANSSFSYWASILNRNNNCTIICPTQFVEPGPNIYLGLNYKWYPKNWVALDLV